MVFSDFAWILGGPGSSKNCKKNRKNQKKLIFRRVQCWRRVLGRFWVSFGRILRGFCMDFNGIWGRFLKLFGRILKDKQWLGRPRERQEVLIIGRVVGWSGGVPKSLVSGGVRTLGFGFHSLFFGVFLEGDFFSIFADLGEILGGFGMPKWA